MILRQPSSPMARSVTFAPSNNEILLGRLTSILLRSCLVATTVFVVAVGTQWKVGSYVGTFEANLMARAALTANAVIAKSPPPIAELTPQGPDYVQVWDDKLHILYRSPGTEDHELPSRPRSIYSVSLPLGRSGYGVTIASRTPDGTPFIATYLTSTTPFLSQVLRTGGAGIFFFVLPTLIFVLLLPKRAK